MNPNSALVIGAGGIGRALLKLLSNSVNGEVHCVTRGSLGDDQATIPNVTYHFIDSSEHSHVRSFCQQFSGCFSQVYCTIGQLHGAELTPEKKLEDLNPEQLASYFHINTILPAIWLKHGGTLFEKNTNGRFVFVSARVGSISDNRLGGWYGYRASKSALNMLIQTAQIEYRRRYRNVALVAYHPGTVDTPLSQPFQKRVPEGKLFSPEQAADYLLSATSALPESHQAHYIDWKGENIAW